MVGPLESKGSRDVRSREVTGDPARGTPRLNGGADDDDGGECATHTNDAGDAGDAIGDGDGVCANDGDDELGSRRSS